MVSRSMDDSEELEDGETTGEIQANKVELNFNVSVSHICVLKKENDCWIMIGSGLW